MKTVDTQEQFQGSGTGGRAYILIMCLKLAEEQKTRASKSVGGKICFPGEYLIFLFAFLIVQLIEGKTHNVSS